MKIDELNNKTIDQLKSILNDFLDIKDEATTALALDYLKNSTSLLTTTHVQHGRDTLSLPKHFLKIYCGNLHRFWLTPEGF